MGTELVETAHGSLTGHQAGEPWAQSTKPGVSESHFKPMSAVSTLHAPGDICLSSYRSLSLLHLRRSSPGGGHWAVPVSCDYSVLLT